MPPFGAFVIVFALSLSLSLLVTPVTVWLGHRLAIVDTAGGRRRGHAATSRLGGIAIFIGFMGAAIAAQFLPVPRFDPQEIIRFTGLVLGGTFIFLIGLLDDAVQFGPIPQFISQIVAAGIAVAFLIFIQMVNNPLTGERLSWAGQHWITVTVSLFWLGLMMNTVNFLDGLDGLASGVSLIAGVMLFIHSAFRLSPPQTSVSLLPLALVGASLGFLLYNFHPARVFMGSSGSYFLGYVLGVLSIIGGAKMATILLVMGLPLLDVVWLIAYRALQGKNPMHGDRAHLHFRLVDRGVSQRRIVLAYYAFCMCFGMLTLITASRLFKLFALAAMMVLVAGVLYWLQRTDPYPKTAENV